MNNVKKLFLLLFIALVTIKVFSQTSTIIESLNIYGGVTVERINESIEGQTWLKMIEYFDNQNNIVKVIFTSTQAIIEERGIIEQTNFYRNNVIERYDILFSIDFFKRHDYNRVVEIVGSNNTIIETIWYRNNQILDRIRYPDDPNRFQFYSVDYIGNMFFDAYRSGPPPTGDVAQISYRYVSIRSVIRFDSIIVDLDDTDMQIIQHLLRRFDASEMSSLYSKKVRVYSENNYYWLFLQTQLIEFVLGQEATVRYYPIGWNGELYMLCVGFTNIM